MGASEQERRYFKARPGTDMHKYFLANLGEGTRVYKACTVDIGDEKRPGLKEVYLVPDKKTGEFVGTFEPDLDGSDEGSSTIGRFQHMRGGKDVDKYIAKGFKFATTEQQLVDIAERAIANKKLNAENRRLRNPVENLKDTVKGIGKELAGALAAQQPRKAQGGA